jgi:enolase-phosphatase E1
MTARFILMDIEGTTTDLAFVQKTLFPYAAEHLPAFIRENATTAAVREALAQVKNTMTSENTDTKENSPGSPPKSEAIPDEAAIAQLLQWIANDRKHTTLKQLQGMVWRHGYESGAYQGHLYPDVLPVLKAWKTDGLELGIYSSGSVEAQQLLFRHSVVGDVTPLLSQYFDTTTGSKREATSYARIAQALKLAPIDILFLSDIAEELDAAAQVGFQVMQLIRGPETRSSNYPSVESFADIRLESASTLC